MSEENHKIILIVSLIILFFCAVFGFIYYKGPALNVQELQSSLDLDPNASRSASMDPDVTAWKTYTNPQYQFTITVPSDWNQEDYTPAHPNGGTLLAFSPDPLPCNSCSYLRNGYFSIRIFNQKTFPEYFGQLAERLKNAQKDPSVKEIMIGQRKGIGIGNTVILEYKGWVFEFSLDRNDGKDSFADSQLFQKVVTSFASTDVLFDN